MGELVSAGHRALVFSQWTNERFGVERIARELRDFDPLTYTGGLSGTERERRIAAFRADPRHGALLLSLRAGGQGLNLQEAPYVVHFDRWWNPAVESQATDRAHRMGQRNPVTVYCYTCLDSIEERIEAILDEKRALFAALVDGVSMDLAHALSPEELFGLLDLPAPARLRGEPEPREDDVVDAVRAELRRAGWEVRRRPAGSDSRVDLKATRVDELGTAEELWLACRDGGTAAGEEDVAAIATAVSGRDGVIGVLASRTQVSPEAAERAGGEGVRIWTVS